MSYWTGSAAGARLTPISTKIALFCFKVKAEELAASVKSDPGTGRACPAQPREVHFCDGVYDDVFVQRHPRRLVSLVRDLSPRWCENLWSVFAVYVYHLQSACSTFRRDYVQVYRRARCRRLRRRVHCAFIHCISVAIAQTRERGRRRRPRC
jgi:hypothetical protein